MNSSSFAQMNVTPLLTMQELGLDRRATVEEAGNGLALVSEAQIVRWVQFPAGVLFFTLVPGDPESGGLYVLDRKTGVFYWLNFDDQKWGGYSLEDYSALVRQHKLTALAQRPSLLERQVSGFAAGVARPGRSLFARFSDSGYVRAGRNGGAMAKRYQASAENVRDYWRLFVNRRAYVVQSPRPHPESGRHYYFRPKAGKNGEPLSLSEAIIRQHLEGRITMGCTP